MAKTLNTGYLRTVLERRGMRTGNDKRLRLLLGTLIEPEAVGLHDAVRRVEQGVESSDDLTLVLSAVAASSDEVHERLEQCGLVMADLHELREVFRRQPGIDRVLMAAAAGDRAKRAELVEALGAKVEEAPPRTPPEVSAVADDPSGKQRRKSVAGLSKDFEDRRKSFARDEPEVQALASRKHHVWASSGALTFEVDKLSRPEEGRLFTVRIEGAQAVGGSTKSAQSEAGKKSYDWSRKLVLQLTVREVHRAAGVFLGLSAKLTCRHHGEDHQKSVELRAQAGGVAVVLSEPGRSIAVPVDASSLYPVALLFMRVLKLNDHDLDDRLLLDTLRLTAALERRD